MAGYRRAGVLLSVFSLLLISSLCVRLAAQKTPPSPAKREVRGKVLDSSAASIAGATITAIPEQQTVGPSVVSDAAGEFTLGLSPGKYTIRIDAPGFLEVSQTVTVTQDSSPPLQFVLQLAEIRQAVTVTSSAAYEATSTRTATKALTKLRDIPQSIAVVTQEQIEDQLMVSIGDVVRYIPGITAIQGENNRDQLVIRGNSTSADFFIDGVRDDVQYYRDLYNLDRVEALKGPNAMMFGRGGGGGVINRVTKEAGFTPFHEVTLQGGSYSNKRFTTDFNQPLNDKAAVRITGMYENSGSFRDSVGLQRYGLNPTLTILAGKQTKLSLSYEHFQDRRVADRGIPSLQNRPADVGISVYFGNPNDSHVRARVDRGSVTLEHEAGRLTIRNHTLLGVYNRGYQNFVPGAVNTAMTQVALSAYNNATGRLNTFNQTDVTFALRTRHVRHTFLAGAEIGRQATDNFRNTGFFGSNATSLLVPFDRPMVMTPITFRQSATDADNHLTTHLAAGYAQDQVELSKYVQLIAGLRFDYFDLQYLNNRNGDRLRRIDDLLSPRAGIVFKPTAPVSIYGSYSVSYLPSSGDQFSSLTVITQQVKPEKFNNYEVGAKWDIARDLSLTTAAYRLDRVNTRSTDPNDPSRIVQTGGQLTNGFEFGLSGSITHRWKVAGGYAFQNAFVTAATTAARRGAQVAQVPHHTFSFWDSYRVTRRLAAALGVVHRSDMFAAVDNTVNLPGYTRLDGAVYYSLTEKMRVQVNVENLLNKTYYINADSNTNISPGSPRAVRAAVIVKF
jgi:catecholate siderophore receptor